jgi:hypothetical protein
MNNSIRLHPEHGLNPTMPCCIVCGHSKNEIALLGNSFKEKAPMSMVISVEPCDDCRKKYLSVGTMICEATEEWKNDKKYPQPTGRLAIIKDEAFKQIFGRELPPRKIAFVDVEVFTQLNSK